jgi:hypothetical protein
MRILRLVRRLRRRAPLGLLRDQPLERGHRFSKFPLIFQRFRSSVLVFAIRHGQNLPGENAAPAQCSDFPQSGEPGEERGYLPSSSN